MKNDHVDHRPPPVMSRFAVPFLSWRDTIVFIPSSGRKADGACSAWCTGGGDERFVRIGSRVFFLEAEGAAGRNGQIDARAVVGDGSHVITDPGTPANSHHSVGSGRRARLPPAMASSATASQSIANSGIVSWFSPLRQRIFRPASVR